MDIINQDFDNVTIAQCVVFKKEVEKAFWAAVKENNLKDAMHYAKLYVKSDKYLNDKIADVNRGNNSKKGRK